VITNNYKLSNCPSILRINHLNKCDIERLLVVNKEDRVFCGGVGEGGSELDISVGMGGAGVIDVGNVPV
jgi:hypothetical protein